MIIILKPAWKKCKCPVCGKQINFLFEASYLNLLIDSVFPWSPKRTCLRKHKHTNTVFCFHQILPNLKFNPNHKYSRRCACGACHCGRHNGVTSSKHAHTRTQLFFLLICSIILKVSCLPLRCPTMLSILRGHPCQVNLKVWFMFIKGLREGVTQLCQFVPFCIDILNIFNHHKLKKTIFTAFG